MTNIFYLFKKYKIAKVILLTLIYKDLYFTKHWYLLNVLFSDLIACIKGYRYVYFMKGHLFKLD